MIAFRPPDSLPQRKVRLVAIPRVTESTSWEVSDGICGDQDPSVAVIVCLNGDPRSFKV